MTSSPDLASLGLASLELATLDPGPDPAGEAGGRRRGAGAASPSWQLRPGSGAAAWRRVCAAGAVGTTSRCCHCPARYATAAETEPTHPRGGGGGGGGEEGRMEERMTGERRERQEGRTRGQKRGRQTYYYKTGSSRLGYWQVSNSAHTWLLLLSQSYYKKTPKNPRPYLRALHLVVRVCDGAVVVSVAVPIVSVVIGRTAGSTWGQETRLQMWKLWL